MVEIAGWIGGITGPLGAIVLALNIPISRYGYILFFTSSILMSVYAYHQNDVQVLVQNVLFSAINLVGLFRWVVLPAMRPVRQIAAE